MAHKKGAGTKAVQGGNVAGKRLGVKVYGGSVVKVGQIILKQRGRGVVPGDNVGMGKDYTIYAKKVGTVQFKWKTKSKKKVNVVEDKDKKEKK